MPCDNPYNHFCEALKPVHEIGGTPIRRLEAPWRRATASVAATFDIKVAGTAAVIGMARQRRLIDSARAVFTELHANDFRIAPAVIQAVLRRCDE